MYTRRYPLAFLGVRDGALDMIGVDHSKRTDSLLNILTVGLLVIVTGVAYVVRDLRLVLAVCGATWGNVITYIFPTFMFLKCLDDKKTDASKQEVWFAIAVSIMGLGMSIIGTMRAFSMANTS
mmetsp:Transcript_16263/g.37355  ORF Transcript_16263/g.37355 Transcript_16263/m.37355 type:complete len:123 (-) Transcript_16263:302-670(-)